MKIREGIKGVLRLISSACVDACVAGGAAAFVPVTMINPIIGVMIVTGAAVTASAVSEKVVGDYVDEKVDTIADMITDRSNEVKDCIEVLKEQK